MSLILRGWQNANLHITVRNPYSKIRRRELQCYPLLVKPQGAKKIIFTACHSGKLKLAFTSPDVISTSPKNFLFFCYSNSSQNITCLLGKLKTEFTSAIAKSTSSGLSDSTFFACWASALSSQTWICDKGGGAPCKDDMTRSSVLFFFSHINACYSWFGQKAHFFSI